MVVMGRGGVDVQIGQGSVALCRAGPGFFSLTRVAKPEKKLLRFSRTAYYVQDQESKPPHAAQEGL